MDSLCNVTSACVQLQSLFAKFSKNLDTSREISYEMIQKVVFTVLDIYVNHRHIELINGVPQTHRQGHLHDCGALRATVKKE